MEKLSEFLIYNKDCDISSIYYNLFKKLEDIHKNGMYVQMLDSNNICHDGDMNFYFLNIVKNYDGELFVYDNVLSLTKMMVGTYLSIFNKFMDFSHVDSKWFFQNVNNINSMISDSNYIPSVLTSVLSGEILYYSSEFDRVNQNNGNNLGRSKIFRNGNIKYYDDEKTTNIDNAFLDILFYPTILFCLSVIAFVFISCLNFFK